MSSYIVTNRCIDRILSCVDINWVVKLGAMNKDELGQKLIKANIQATEQRYLTNPYLTKKQAEKRIKTYKFSEELPNKIQALKSLHCLHYQMSEGTIPNMRLYKLLEKLADKWAYDIVNELPEYDKAEWG
jgi:hypothetical protein